MENGVDNGVYEDAVGTSSALDVCITAASIQVEPGVFYTLITTTFQGGRRYMEDRVHIEVVRKEDGSIDYIYAGVYDGHGGAQASEYVRLHLLNNIRVIRDGSTWHPVEYFRTRKVSSRTTMQRFCTQFAWAF